MISQSFARCYVGTSKGITITTLKNTNSFRYLTPSHSSPRRCMYRNTFGTVNKTYCPGRNMSFKVLWKDLCVARIWSVWTRSYLISNVVKRCRRERGVKEVLQCFRHTFLRPRRTLLLAATAAYHRGDDEEPPASCNNSITDEDMKALLTELTSVEELSRRTLFCARCGHRLPIDKKHPGVHYCTCDNGSRQPESLDGWVPYMEAEDVIIWRKEYKPGQGLYAYKVYGRYGEVRARDFAAVQVDGAYRRAWDAAVASLSVVERRANGLPDQAVLHWEVLWPRLFANRDYVYIRRHKEYDMRSSPRPHTDGLFPTAGTGPTPEEKQQYDETASVHSNAKRKAIEAYSTQKNDSAGQDNKVYVIISRSCEHPKVPVSKHAIRVSEYWSHMVIKTLDGADKTGMEFVLTYYDEPAVGGLPHGVATWATGRAAPAYLQRMRSAALHYATTATASTHPHQELPDFTPFVPKSVSNEEGEKSSDVSEEEMESSKQGPELNGNHKQAGRSTREQSTQTDERGPKQAGAGAETGAGAGAETGAGAGAETGEGAGAETGVREGRRAGAGERDYSTPRTDGHTTQMKESPPTLEEDSKPSEENNGSWWRYLYPFYYFV